MIFIEMMLRVAMTIMIATAMMRWWETVLPFTCRFCLHIFVYTIIKHTSTGPLKHGSKLIILRTQSFMFSNNDAMPYNHQSEPSWSPRLVPSPTMRTSDEQLPKKTTAAHSAPTLWAALHFWEDLFAGQVVSRQLGVYQGRVGPW